MREDMADRTWVCAAFYRAGKLVARATGYLYYRDCAARGFGAEQERVLTNLFDTAWHTGVREYDRAFSD